MDQRPLIHHLVEASARLRQLIVGRVSRVPRIRDRHGRRRPVHHDRTRTRPARQCEDHRLSAIGDAVGRCHQRDRGAPCAAGQRHLARQSLVVHSRCRRTGHRVANRHVPRTRLAAHRQRELRRVAFGDRAARRSRERHRERVGRLPEHRTVRRGGRGRDARHGQHGREERDEPGDGSRHGVSRMMNLGGRRRCSGSECHERVSSWCRDVRLDRLFAWMDPLRFLYPANGRNFVRRR